MSDSEILYKIINDFITENPIPRLELFGIFEIIKIEQGYSMMEEAGDENEIEE